MEIEYGTVIRASSGSYVVTVQPTSSDGAVCCVATASVLSAWAGIDDCSIPGEGTTVSFIRYAKDGNLGIVLGSVAARASSQEALVDAMSSSDVISSGVSAADVTSGLKEIESWADKYIQATTAIQGRPLDVFPGDKVFRDKQSGVGLLLLSCLSALTASERSRVECYVMDDLVRIVSGHFQHFGPLGEMQCYNDCGRLSTEYRVTNHQQEYFGKDKFEKVSELRTRDKSKDNKATGSLVGEDKGPRDLRERFQTFIGDLGSFVHVVICNPALDSDRMKGVEVDYQGLFRQILSKSGGLNIQHSDDLILQRTDKIPVPCKLKEPWDPEGDGTNEITYTDKPNKPFKLDQENKWSAALSFRDMVAHTNMQNLKPFDRREKDWHLPEEKDVPALTDEYDNIDKDKTEFEDNVNRQSFIGQLKDGSIVFRDAWGSSIYMRGGSIIFDCPGEMVFKSGRSQVHIAGHDICLKAANSADLTADMGDVRIKAQKNMHIVSEERGVLVEAGSTYEIAEDKLNFKDTVGEDVKSGGIILKATNDRIFLWGRIVQLSANFKIMLETIMNSSYRLAQNISQAEKLAETQVGEIILSTAKIIQKASKWSLLSKKGPVNTGILVEKGNVTTYGNKITTYSTTTQGIRFFTNFKYTGSNKDIPVDPSKDIIPKRYEPNEIDFQPGKAIEPQTTFNALMVIAAEQYKRYSGNDWLGRNGYHGYNLDNPEGTDSQRPHMFFSFRTPEQYHTDVQGEIDYAPTDSKKDKKDKNIFRLYQSPWEYMYGKLVEDKKEDRLVNWTPVGRVIYGYYSAPWPGYKASDKIIRAIDKEEVNIDYKQGISKERDKLKDTLELVEQPASNTGRFLYKHPDK